MSQSLDEMRTELRAAVANAATGVAAADELCVACVRLFGIDGAAVSVVLDGASHGTFGSSDRESRRLDEYQFTYGEGPCLDAVSTRSAVLAPDLDTPTEQRWPAFAGAALADGIRGVFALPIIATTSVCIGALDLFRLRPAPLQGVQLAGALLAAELAAAPLSSTLFDLLDEPVVGDERTDAGQLDRVEVYQATGMLIAQLDVDAEEALLRLRAHAIAVGRTASQVAQDIVARRLRLERDDKGERGGRP